MPFIDLLPEVLLSIADYLDEKSILSLLRCHRRLHDILISYLYLRDANSGGLALSWCAEHGFEQGVKRMLQLKVDPDTPRTQFEPSAWWNCSTPLFLAAKHGHEDVVRLLVKEKVEINLPLLICTSQGGYEPTVTTTLGQGPYERIAQVLLEHGANPNFLGYNNITPLTLAIQSPNLDMVELLLNHGATVDYPGDPSQDQSSWIHPIHAWLQPSRQGSSTSPDLSITGRLLGLLVRHGADINWQNDKGKGPIHVAAEEDVTGLVVRQLIQHGADVNLRKPGLSAALHACTVEAAVALIENGADVNMKDLEGNSPLHCAIFRPKMLRILLDAGADPNIRDHRNREGVLLRAAGVADADVVRLLLERGAYVNMSNDGETPLHRAVRFARKRNVRLLLAFGARVNAQRDRGETPLDDLYRHGRTQHLDEVHLAIRQMLLEHGAATAGELRWGCFRLK